MKSEFTIVKIIASVENVSSFFIYEHEPRIIESQLTSFLVNA